MTKGFDVLFVGIPVRGLSVNAGIACAHAIYPNGCLTPGGADQRGQHLANAPCLRATFSGEHSSDLTETAQGIVSPGAKYQSQRGHDFTGNNLEVVPAPTNLGRHLGARVGEDLTIAIFSRNLTNQSMPVGEAPACPLTILRSSSQAIPGEGTIPTAAASSGFPLTLTANLAIAMPTDPRSPCRHHPEPIKCSSST